MLLSHSVTSVGLLASLFPVEIKFSTRVLYVLHAKFVHTHHLLVQILCTCFYSFQLSFAVLCVFLVFGNRFYCCQKLCLPKKKLLKELLLYADGNFIWTIVLLLRKATVNKRPWRETWLKGQGKGYRVSGLVTQWQTCSVEHPSLRGCHWTQTESTIGRN